MINDDIDLAPFAISHDRGFLPDPDPLDRLPPAFEPWEELGRNLPKLLVTTQLRPRVEALEPLDPSPLREPAELERAMMLLSFIGHAYVWGGSPVARIPAGLAVPWHAVAERLGRPPVLSYASYSLANWRRIDPGGPIALGNIGLLQNFFGGLDEEWFVIVHVDIEARAAPAIAALLPAQRAAAAGDLGELERRLAAVASALEQMVATLDRMPEGCDPYIYYNRVRPYIFGWKNNPALPEGMRYDGVAAYGGQPQIFAGETGAQSAIVPALDAALGIAHRDDPLRPYLMEMRDYMPPPHRAFIAALEGGPSIRAFVMEHRERPGLTERYNACVTLLQRFRARHLEYAARYIHQQSQRSEANTTIVGTGGTPFMPYLKKHRDETEEHLIV